jgi:hypothetical protein
LASGTGAHGADAPGIIRLIQFRTTKRCDVDDNQIAASAAYSLVTALIGYLVGNGTIDGKVFADILEKNTEELPIETVRLFHLIASRIDPTKQDTAQGDPKKPDLRIVRRDPCT